MNATLMSGMLTVAFAGSPAVQTWEIDAHTTGVYIHDNRAPLVTAWIQVPVGRWHEGVAQ